MRTTRRIVQMAMLGAGVVGAAVAATPDRGPGRWMRRAADRLASDARYMAAAVPGFTYRISGGHPDTLPLSSDWFTSSRSNTLREPR